MIPHGSLASSSTAGTCCMAAIRLLAVLALITRRVGDAAAALYLPELVVEPWTRLGWTRTPPLAMGEDTAAICTASASTPCPNDRVYRSLPHHEDTLGKMPWLSPGRFSPVTEPRPKFRRYWYWVCGVTCLTTWTMPSLLELARMPAIVHCSTGWDSASWKLKPSSVIESGTGEVLVFFWPPVSRAAAAVTTLAVLPGSNTSWTARFSEVVPV